MSVHQIALIAEHGCIAVSWVLSLFAAHSFGQSAGIRWCIKHDAEAWGEERSGSQ